MVIFSKDDDLSFLKEQATTGGTGIRMSNNPPVVISVPPPTTIAFKGDNNTNLQQQQQQQQQLQKQLQQQLNQSFINNNAKNNNNTLTNNNTLQIQQQPQQQPSAQQQQQQQPQVAKAILLCRPQSHPFNKRILRLEPNQEVKVGRAVARNKVCESNAIFECKVLSRNHAVIWYGNGRFFIKDTGSSNGTFINNHRLSEASFASEPYEVNSGDVVQFGVEVVENERKDTHGCIIATLKLYLPDGPETKTRQADTKVSAADLYRLNQYMQEAVKREHILETKLLNLQKNIQLTRKNSANNWQAMIDEDRLLSRIDYLEKKLQYFEKNVTEDKLKEDVIKLQEDKNEYQNSAKEALRKVYQERQDALQKLTALERALITNDDECSSLRDQLMKTQQQLTDLTNELCQMQTQYDEKCSELDECKRKMELEILTCHHKMSELQFEIENYEQNQMSVRLNVVADWLSKSDIKKNIGSDDIIKAICNDKDDNEGDGSGNMENKCALIYEKLLAIEKNIYSIVAASSQDSMKIVNDTKNISPKIVHIQNNGSATIAESDEKSDESSQLLTGSAEQPQQCDDNQNNMNDNQAMEAENEKEQHDNLILNTTNNVSMSDELKVNLKTNFSQLLEMFSALMHQLTELQKSNRANKCITLDDSVETAANDGAETETLNDLSISGDDVSEIFVGSIGEDEEEETTMAANLEELESQLLSLKLELETRPSFKEYQDKLKHIDDLNDSVTIARLEIANLRSQIDSNLIVIKNLENELQDVKKIQLQNLLHTDADVDKDTQMEKVDACLQTELLAVEEEPVAQSSVTETQTPPSQAADDLDNNNSMLVEEELQIINHPAIEQEEELILYKEKYTNLSSEKIRLEQELQQMRQEYDTYKNKSLTNLILYLSPIIAIISYLMFSYLMK